MSNVNPAIEVVDAEINAMLSDPAVRNQANRFMREALERDPLDAAEDATLVARLLSRRVRSLRGEAATGLPELPAS